MSSTARPPFPKKKVALLFGYSGAGYSGLQLNPGTLTIESVLFDALVKAGLIWDKNAQDPKKVDWQRACRTDKGVHAAGNLISFKAVLIKENKPNDSLDDGDGADKWSSQYAVKQINKFLPAGIRVFDVVRVTNSFDSHTQCDARFYEYVFPSAMLAKSSLEDLFMFTDKVNADGDGDGDRDDVSALEDDKDSMAPTISEHTLSLYKSFKVDDIELQRLADVLSLYVGTHNFHNFTIGKLSSDPSSQRFIRSFIIQDVFECDEIQWIRLRIHGSSFMLHQIRKMVGLAILCVRFALKDSLIVSTLSKEGPKTNVPKAPGIGLYLDRAVFEGYNKYLKNTTAQDVSGDCIDLSKYEAERELLKHQVIYPAIFGPGVGFFTHWISGLKAHAHEFLYLKQHQ